jgi:glyoxylase-like metal-dependent hydrolase (beta-lactamase superfamily II)
MMFVALLAVGGGGVVGMRAGRGKAQPALEVKPGIYGTKSAGSIFLFGARAGRSVILFDTGADPQAKPVDALLKGLGASRGDVHDIFLTNGNFDHVAGAASFSGWGARTYLGAADAALAAGRAEPDALATRLLTLVLRPDPVMASNPIEGPQTIPVGQGKGDDTGGDRVGDTVVKAFPVPGHTPGAFVYLYDGVLFVGDIMIVKEGRLETAPAVFDAHPDQNRAAIRSLKTQLVAEILETICTGHGGCTGKGLGRNMLDDLISRI